MPNYNFPTQNSHVSCAQRLPCGSHRGVIKCYIHYQVHSGKPHAVELQKWQQQQQKKAKPYWPSDSYCTQNCKALAISNQPAQKNVFTGFYESYFPSSWLQVFQRYLVLFEALSSKFTCQSGLLSQNVGVTTGLNEKLILC